MAAGDSVQQIKDRLNILEVIAPYVELHKAGKHYKGKSPFSPEKTPSFYVSPDRGMYYCFSTNQGGDMFTFIETIEGVDFKEALKQLADKAGVELVPEDPKKKSERERIIALIEAATTYFETELAGNKESKEYLEKRGVKEETISHWRIGYAPGPPARGWREVRTHLKTLGYTDDEMLKAGVIKKTEGGKEPFDVFRDRVMFPMAEQNGTIVAYSGRILAKDSDAPKYVNSPETMLYHKSELLFGYDKARVGIRQFDFSLIVEGQFDVVMCHQAGYHNAVAVSGTALTTHHVGLLERLTGRVVLALDADRAGIAAVKRSAEVMLRRGLDVKVAKMPEGTDPADMIAEDPKRFKAVIGKSTHVIQFVLGVLRAHAKDERTFKLQAREEVVPLLAIMPNHIDREHFEKETAEALGVSQDSIHYEVERVVKERANAPKRASEITKESPLKTVPPAPHREVEKQKNELTEYLLIAAEVLPERERAVLDGLLSEVLKGERTAVREAISAARASELMFTIEQYAAETRERMLVEDLVHQLSLWHTFRVKDKIRQVRTQLAETERLGETDRTTALLTDLQQLQKDLLSVPYNVSQFEKR